MATRCCCPPGEGRSTLRSELGQTDALQRLHGALRFLGIEQAEAATPARHAPQTAEQHVLHHTEAADQIELLEDVADIGALTAHVAVEATVGLDLATEHFDTAGIAARQAGEMAQQGRLARPRSTDQGHHFTWLYRQRQVEQRLFAAEALVQTVDSNRCAHGLALYYHCRYEGS